jgi:c-di-GMP-binding flagellar brake protein YcgR
MTFYPERNLVLVNYQTVEKEAEGKKKKYTFATLADPETYENQTFMLSKDHSLLGLQARNQYRVALEVEGKYSTATLLAPERKPPAA